MKATYVSIWDSDILVKTPCEYDPINKIVSDIIPVDIEGLQICEGEYIELPDGTEIEKENFTYADDEN